MYAVEGTKDWYIFATKRQAEQLAEVIKPCKPKNKKAEVFEVTVTRNTK
jgi:hypothetical protein